MSKIHIVSDWFKLNSGFSEVARNLAIGLAKRGHDVSMTAIQSAYVSEEYEEEYEENGIKKSIKILQLPLYTSHTNDQTQLALNLRDINPDLVVCVFQSDSPEVSWITKMSDMIGKKTIWYTVVEGSRVPKYSLKDMLEVIEKGGKIVVPTKFAANEIKKEGIVGFQDIPIIPYGHNPEIFNPTNISDSSEMGYVLGWNVVNNEGRWIQREVNIGMMWSDILFKGKFVFLCVAQNMGIRKRFERLLNAYAMTIESNRQMKDRTILHLHTMPINTSNEQRGYNLIEEVERLGIQKNISFSYGRFRSSGWSEKGMSELYRLSDCFVTASSGEGYCLPILNSMACGKSCIAPNFTSFTELISDSEIIVNDYDVRKYTRGFLAKLDTIQMVINGSYKGLVNEEDLGILMKKIFTMDKNERLKMEANAYEWAAKFTWDNMVGRFDNEIRKLINYK